MPEHGIIHHVEQICTMNRARKATERATPKPTVALHGQTQNGKALGRQ